jgi:hypothetical protein
MRACQGQRGELIDSTSVVQDQNPLAAAERSCLQAALAEPALHKSAVCLEGRAAKRLGRLGKTVHAFVDFNDNTIVVDEELELV